MREHKYHAWDKAEKKIRRVFEITYWYPEPSGSLTLHGCKLESMDRKWWAYVLAEDLELLPYTNIKDSKELEIFKGDIIKVIGMYGKIQYAKVIWGPVNNMYTWMNGETWLLHFAEGVEGPLYPYCQRHHGYEVSVAGNVYENHELLETKA